MKKERYRFLSSRVTEASRSSCGKSFCQCLREMSGDADAVKSDEDDGRVLSDRESTCVERFSNSLRRPGREFVDERNRLVRGNIDFRDSNWCQVRVGRF